jgi:hypothetical protein
VRRKRDLLQKFYIHEGYSEEKIVYVEVSYFQEMQGYIKDMFLSLSSAAIAR